MKWIHLVIAGLFAGFLFQEAHAQKPGKIPASFLGEWLSAESPVLSQRTRFQNTGMIDRSIHESGIPSVVRYSRNGKITVSYQATLDVDGVGSVVTNLSINGKWTYKRGVLKTNGKVTYNFPSLNRKVTGRFWSSERIVNGQSIVNSKVNIVGETFRARTVQNRVPEVPEVPEVPLVP